MILQEAFSLLAYADPWSSPVAGQLDPAGREAVCHTLNSAILGRWHILLVIMIIIISYSLAWGWEGEF